MNLIEDCSQQSDFGPPAWPLMARLNLASLVVLVAGYCVLLWPQWVHNPDLSHGLFLPILVWVLLHEARCAGPQRYLSAGTGIQMLFVVSVVGSLVSLSLAGLYAAATEWEHPVVADLLATAVAGLGLATLTIFSQNSRRWIPFNWSSFLAVALWILSAPIPPGTYNRLTFGLQIWISENVLATLHLLGIVAVRHGNIIELAQTSVGVEEACSGVRSLVSCVVVGLFFSGCLVRRFGSRVLIVAISAPLALGMNFLRSLTLTLLANAGVEIAGPWHDFTGFAVLGVTAAILGVIALASGRRERIQVTPQPSSKSALAAPTHEIGQLALSGAFLTTFLIVGFFWTNTAHRSESASSRSPDMEALLPTAIPGWSVITDTELSRFKDTLRTDHFVQRTYVRESRSGPIQFTAYVAYWAPGQASASQVATHTPDACWPGAGWQAVPVAVPRESLTVGSRTLPPSEHRLFSNQEFPQHVWFWHLYDGHPLPYLDPLSPSNVIKLAVRQGFHRDGDQLFVRLSSNYPWDEVAREPLLTEIFAKLQPLGL